MPPAVRRGAPRGQGSENVGIYGCPLSEYSLRSSLAIRILTPRLGSLPKNISLASRPPCEPRACSRSKGTFSIYYNGSFYVTAPNFVTRLFLPTRFKSLDFIMHLLSVDLEGRRSQLPLRSQWAAGCSFCLAGAAGSSLGPGSAAVSGERLPRAHSPSGLREGPPGSHAAPGSHADQPLALGQS